VTQADLSRLLHPGSIAVFGGGWARNVVEQCLKGGYQGQLWPVHPKAADMHGIACVDSVSGLPGAPDAAFVGINREASIEIVRELREIGGQINMVAVLVSTASHYSPSHPTSQ